MSNLKTMYPGQVNSPFTTTLGEISATDAAVVVADASVLPTEVPFLLTLGYDKSASETVLVTAVSGNTLTITRAVDGPALLWVAGTKAARVFTAKDLNDVQDNIRTLNQDKQENLTIDAAPTQGSGNPVSSGGVQSALAGKQNNLTFDAVPKQGSQNPITSDGVYSALAGKQDNLTIDSAPVQNSTNPVASGGVHSALAAKANAASLASHTGNTSNPHKVTAAQIGAATPAEITTAVDDISCIGDLRMTIGVPSENWLPCDGSGVMEADYPALVPLLGQNVKRWPAGDGSRPNFFHVNGKLLLSGEQSIWEYLPDSDEWVEHTNVADYGSILCITYHNGTWIVAAGWLVMYVYTSTSLDGPWEKHGSYANMSTIYPTSVIPKGDGGLIVAGYNFYNYLGVGILTADFQWSYTMFSETDKFGTCFIKKINGYWIIGTASSGNSVRPCIIYSQDPALPASSWTKVQLPNTNRMISDIAYFDDTWVASLYSDNNFSKYGISLAVSANLGSGWALKNVDMQSGTPYVRQMCVDNGVLYAVGWKNGPFVLRAESLNDWTCRKLREAGNEYPCITVDDGGVFAYSYNSGTDRCVAKILDVTKDLLWDAALPNVTPDAGTTYIKAK